eukprot:scaffold2468_cov226-Pinguiococcus_pyrenoidosus.AAC.3
MLLQDLNAETVSMVPPISLLHGEWDGTVPVSSTHCFWLVSSRQQVGRIWLWQPAAQRLRWLLWLTRLAFGARQSTELVRTQTTHARRTTSSSSKKWRTVGALTSSAGASVRELLTRDGTFAGDVLDEITYQREDKALSQLVFTQLRSFVDDLTAWKKTKVQASASDAWRTSDKTVGGGFLEDEEGQEGGEEDDDDDDDAFDYSRHDELKA